MSVFKTTFSRALRAHPSDNADISYPNQIAGGTNTTATAFKLINSAALYLTKNVKTGDIVHNDTAGTAATVVSVDSETQLTLNANIFTSTFTCVASMHSRTKMARLYASSPVEQAATQNRTSRFMAEFNISGIHFCKSTSKAS